MSAIQAWKRRVETHHAQSEAVMAAAGWADDDFWQPYARFFRQDPRRTDDAVLNMLLSIADGMRSALDVGGGAGRMALPLALQCEQVHVVEPSGSMIEHLTAGANEANIGNVSVTQATWEAANVDAADLALCAHVLYGVADLEPFVRKLEGHANELVVILSFVESPMTRISAFWEPVHGEERVDMPALPELVNALWEMGIYPNVRMLPPVMPDLFEDRETALGQLRNRLYVKAGTAEDRRLQDAMERLLVEVDGGVAVRGVAPVRQGFLYWKPE